MQARIAEASQAAGACDSQHNCSSLAQSSLTPLTISQSPPSTMLTGLPSTMFLGDLLQFYGASKNMGVAAKALGFLIIRAQGLQILTGPYFFF